MAVAGISHHVFACIDLFKVDIDDTETDSMSGSMVSVIIFEQFKKDIPVLPIAQCGNILFVHTSMNNMSLCISL